VKVMMTCPSESDSDDASSHDASSDDVSELVLASLASIVALSLL
jgi:hypothetical protein